MFFPTTPAPTTHTRVLLSPLFNTVLLLAHLPNVLQAGVGWKFYSPLPPPTPLLALAIIYGGFLCRLIKATKPCLSPPTPLMWLQSLRVVWPSLMQNEIIVSGNIRNIGLCCTHKSCFPGSYSVLVKNPLDIHYAFMFIAVLPNLNDIIAILSKYSFKYIQ